MDNRIQIDKEERTHRPLRKAYDVDGDFFAFTTYENALAFATAGEGENLYSYPVDRNILASSVTFGENIDNFVKMLYNYSCG